MRKSLAWLSAFILASAISSSFNVSAAVAIEDKFLSTAAPANATYFHLEKGNDSWPQAMKWTKPKRAPSEKALDPVEGQAKA